MILDKKNENELNSIEFPNDNMKGQQEYSQLNLKISNLEKEIDNIKIQFKEKEVENERKRKMDQEENSNKMRLQVISFSEETEKLNKQIKVFLINQKKYDNIFDKCLKENERITNLINENNKKTENNQKDFLETNCENKKQITSLLQDVEKITLLNRDISQEIQKHETLLMGEKKQIEDLINNITILRDNNVNNLLSQETLLKNTKELEIKVDSLTNKFNEMNEIKINKKDLLKEIENLDINSKIFQQFEEKCRKIVGEFQINVTDQWNKNIKSLEEENVIIMCELSDSKHQCELKYRDLSETFESKCSFKLENNKKNLQELLHSIFEGNQNEEESLILTQIRKFINEYFEKANFSIDKFKKLNDIITSMDVSKSN